MARTITIVITILFLCGAVRAQQGESSIAAGPVISFPLKSYGYSSYLKTGTGLELIGQHSFSNRSSFLSDMGWVFYRVRPQTVGYETDDRSIFSFKLGYKYTFGASGVFLNGLVGTDIEQKESYISFTFGAGKRFLIKDAYFIDAGVDYIEGDTEPRLNIKVLFSVLRRNKEND